MTGQTSLLDELIVDNFAGGGGASTGIELATGRPVDIAINHDPDAIAMHKANHPYTHHLCESVWDIDPRKECKGHPIGLAWFSPDCKHFSKAKGGKPVDKNIRGLAWVALRWAATVKPRVIMLENVEEFKTWGPIIPMRDKETGRMLKKVYRDETADTVYDTVVAAPDEIVACELRIMYPDPQRKGRTFNSFVNALRYQGYAVEWRELRACDFGAPTIRKRFFLIARCDGQPIVWPEPTHGDPKSEAVKSGKLKPWRTAAEIIDWSIPCPSIFERSRPLAENTMKRIARGLKKFVIDNPEPFIVRICQTGFGGDRMQYDIKKPLTTVVSKAEHCLVTPYITKFQQNSIGQVPDAPIDTVMAGATRFAVIAPYITQYHGLKSDTDVRGQEVTNPVLTLDGAGRYGLTTATLIQTGYGERAGQQPRALDIDKPLGTIVSTGKHALITAFLQQHYGGGYTSHGNEPDSPLNTVTASDHNCICTSHLIKMKGTNYGQEVEAPLQTITAGGLHFGEVRAFLLKYYGTGEGQDINDPLGTVTTKDRFGLVTVAGEQYQIADIGMRMLEPHELYAAQGFPMDYKIAFDVDGKRYPKSEQVARCGNAVPPPFATALVRANLPEWCDKTITTMRELGAVVAS